MEYLKGIKPSGSMVIAIIALVIAGAGTAVAAATITGKDIVNGAVSSKKVKDNSLKAKDLSASAKKTLQGEPGPIGPQGPAGPQGEPGISGEAVYSNPEWGIIDRNTEGSPVAALRGGPIFGAAANQQPPLGEGSLGIETASNQEKVAFGNQVDFAGDAVGDLDQLGFSYFVTGEDLGRYAANTPNLTLEINPSVGNKDYTSMVYNPPAPAAATQQWVDADADADDGTGNSGWWFTNGTVSGATGCTQANYCSLDEAQAALVANNDGGAPASILTIAIGKGKDYQYQGAADALRVNGTVFDFEPFGVFETTP